MIQELSSRGYHIATGILESSTISKLVDVLSSFESARSERRGVVYGIRDLLYFDEIRFLSRSDPIRKLVAPVVGTNARAVRGIFFDKAEGANWPVLWHQDLSVAVSEKHNLGGWQAWSLKNGVAHVQPPTIILEQMLTVRLHLDDCGAENGPLKVRPGTHEMGRLARERIRALETEIHEEVC